MSTTRTETPEPKRSPCGCASIRRQAAGTSNRSSKSGDAENLVAVLRCLEGSEHLLPAELVESVVEKYHASGEPAARRLAAIALGFLPPDSVATTYLSDLIEDPDVETARTAAASAGKLRRTDALPCLVDQLRRRSVRVSAREAIARFGPDGLEALTKRLHDESTSLDLRVSIPRAMAEIEDQEAIDALFELLPHDDHRLHYQVIKALSKLRSRFPTLRFLDRDVDRLLELETREMTELSRLRRALERRRTDIVSLGLLARVLEERIEFTRERIFRLLGLEYPHEEVAGAWNRIAYGRPSVRAGALEYLSNVLAKKHRLAVFPLLESADWAEIDRRSSPETARPAESLSDALASLIGFRDDWVVASAVTVAGELELSSLGSKLAGMKEHPSPLVREVVEKALADR